MSIPELIALVAVTTEVIKKAFLRIHIEIKGVVAVFLAVMVSACVVIFDALKNGTALTFQSVILWLEVAIGSTIGYSIFTKVSSAKN